MTASRQVLKPTRVPVRTGYFLVCLLAGGGLIVMSFMRYSLAEFGWVTFAPLLAVLHERGSLGRHLAVLATLVVAFLAAVSKMATAEIPWAPVPMFAIPLALSYFLALSFASMAHRRLGARWGAYAFASMTVVLGWVQYTWTPGSSWGVLAHTQLDNLPLVQLAALTGVGGITFLVALGSGLTAAAWSRGLQAIRTDIWVFGVLVVSALFYGQVRLGAAAPGDSVLVGGVVSPVTHNEFRAAHTDLETLRPLDDELFARSARAADRGAQVVVWNEMATLVSVTGEGALAARGQAFAREREVMLLMAYGVVDSMDPFHDTNKYRIYLPDGTMADEYVKRHPVPGDPDTVGTSHARVVNYGGVNYVGAICYDFGFPEIARDNASDGGSVALVPSSDWRGIDPGHGRMARMNAVAVGLSMVRPVRAATSIATDPYGRILGSMRADRQGDGVMVVAVPGQRVSTVYATTGEMVPIGALLFCLLVVVRALRSRKNGDTTFTGASPS
ncbi:nitrilase-related carbon-nitrogen hydrolase [Marinobacter caseinilyticus]|uniref:nitrilase-related carbon-nitrogen hydrolase n=1 Tax=Marinobacter caseinilyticus TaxID=2692195 RepID=UPI00140E4364|nr:nitrilase-related carbon-nitrogen hydrolase [Marinobacter caseinilyticus]